MPQSVRSFRSFLALAAILSLFPAAARAAITPDAGTTATQMILVDDSTGTVLAQRNADEKMHPSSMSKLMTTYMVFDKLKSGALKLEDTFTVSEKAWRMQGSKMFVHVGDQVSVSDLLHGVIVQSGNDACIVLAEGLSGSEESFAADMNKKAKELGLTNSHFTNSTGWPDENHLMSPRDLATLSHHLINDFPEYYPLFSVESFTYNKISQPNRNTLIGRLGIDGLKTGHTEAGGYGIVVSGEQNGHRLIAVVNGMDSMKARIAEAERLISYGFREFESRKLADAGAVLGDAEVWMGQSKTVPLVTNEPVLVSLPKSGHEGMTMKIHYTGPLQAPVQKGTKVGELTIETPGLGPVKKDVFAGADVPELTGVNRILPALKHVISK